MVNNTSFDKIKESIIKSDTIVFSFHLYVDSPLSSLLNLLTHLIEEKINLKNKRIYTIINCGFKEGEQNVTAMEIIKRWCFKTKAIYNGSLLIGAGEIVGKEKYKFISKKALKQINLFSSTIKNNEIFNDTVTTMDYLNNKIYCTLANISWNKKCRKNNLSKREIYLN